MKISLEFDEKEADEIVTSVWFNMNIDYKQFSLLDAENRVVDAERFASVQGVRYAILSRVVGAARGCANYEEYEKILARASDVIVIARGVQHGQGGAEAEMSGDSGNNPSDAERQKRCDVV